MKTKPACLLARLGKVAGRWAGINWPKMAKITYIVNNVRSDKINNEIAEVVGLKQNRISQIINNVRFDKINNEIEGIAKSGSKDGRVVLCEEPPFIYGLGLLGWTQEERAKVGGVEQPAISEIIKKFDVELFDKEYKSGLTPETIADNHSLREVL